MENQIIDDPCPYVCPKCGVRRCEKNDLHYEQFQYADPEVLKHRCTPCNLKWIQNQSFGDLEHPQQFEQIRED